MGGVKATPPLAGTFTGVKCYDYLCACVLFYLCDTHE